MKFGFLIAVFSIFSAQSFSAVPPKMSINKDPVCGIYAQAYEEQLSRGLIPSFETTEIASHPEDTVYTPSAAGTIPIKFTAPLVHSDISWMQWLPIANLTHSFKWGGAATDVTAVGAIKPNNSSSFVFQAHTIGWRGPFYRVWLIDDAKLQALITDMTSASEAVPIEGSGAKLIFPSSESGFRQSLTNLFRYQRDFYLANDDQVYKVTSGNPELVCEIGLANTFKSSQLTALEQAANSSLMTKGITHIPLYYGSMGNPHVYVDDGFDVAIQKPWLIKSAEDGKCYQSEYIDYCEKNKRVEAVLETYAASDPWSYREVQALRQHMSAAMHVLSDYYSEEMAINENLAIGMAKQAVYNFLERTVKLHPYIGYGVEEHRKANNSYSLDDADGSIEANWFNKTELMWAAHFNDYDAISRFLAHPSSLNAVTASDDEYASVQFLNRSALIYAVENASLPTIQLLINAGADLAIKDSKGNDLEHYFAKNPMFEGGWQQVRKSLPASVSASFNCELAKTHQEKAICNSEGLSIYDAQLGNLYKQVRATKQFPEIKTLQRKWLRSMRQSCSMKDSKDLTVCMKQEYRGRIKYLMNLLQVHQDS